MEAVGDVYGYIYICVCVGIHMEICLYKRNIYVRVLDTSCAGIC